MKQRLILTLLLTAIAIQSLQLLFDILPIDLFAADAYYLPLREIPLGEHQEAVERSIVETSWRLNARRLPIAFGSHAVVLVALVAALAYRFSPPRPENVRS